MSEITAQDKFKAEQENARAMIASMQQIRLRYLENMMKLMNYSFLLVMGIWSFMLRAYFDNPSQPKDKTYILIATALSSLILSIWRFWTRQHANQITNMFPSLIYYENVLSVPIVFCTSGFLVNRIKPLKRNKDRINNLTNRERTHFFYLLAQMKRLGSLNHLFKDILVLITITGTIILTTQLEGTINNKPIFIFCFIIIVISIIIIGFAICAFQHDPKSSDIKKVLEEVRKKYNSNFINYQ